jgi:hypothetical protein
MKLKYTEGRHSPGNEPTKTQGIDSRDTTALSLGKLQPVGNR